MSEKWDNKEDRATAKKLSLNACFTPDEFQAELFAAKRNAEDITEDIIKLYEKYGGRYENL